MCELIDKYPYAERDDAALLAKLNWLTAHHRSGCEQYAKIWPATETAKTISDLPFLHVGLFKQLRLQTQFANLVPERALLSSGTGGRSSIIVLDQESSRLQSASVTKILSDFIGKEAGPLLLLESVDELRRRGEVSARLAAGMSIRPLCSDLFFILGESANSESLRIEVIEKALHGQQRAVIYGFSWLLWLTLGQPQWSERLIAALRGKDITFVHSGGWKKLSEVQVSKERFDAALLQHVSTASKVVDFYGLVEQVGIVYPLCAHGSRHVPVWADVVVRDPRSLSVIEEGPGQLQLLNCLAYGAPYHSVLTEDRAQVLPGPCRCGRKGKRFELLGRLAHAEVRGCSNV